MAAAGSMQSVSITHFATHACAMQIGDAASVQSVFTSHSDATHPPAGVHTCPAPLHGRSPSLTPIAAHWSTDVQQTSGFGLVPHAAPSPRINTRMVRIRIVSSLPRPGC